MIYIKANELETPEARKALVTDMVSEIQKAKTYYEEDFSRMREDMDVARLGQVQNWPEDAYVVNITQRYIRQKTSTLYAKNPVATYKRKPRLDFMLWDGTMAEMEQAVMAVQMSMEAGMPAPPEAVALLEDIQQGQQQRKVLDRVGETLSLVYQYYIDEQVPAFKDRMKACVRQCVTTGVSYVKLGFYRINGPSVQTQQKIDEVERRLAHLQRLAGEQASGDSDESEPEFAELQFMLQALRNEPDVVLREGLTFDFPQSTAIIVDPACTQLKTFAEAAWVAEEFWFTADEFKEKYKVEIDSDYEAPKPNENTRVRNTEPEDDLVPVYELYHNESGLRFVFSDAVNDFLEEPGPPPLKLEQFYPWFVYSYNELPNNKTIYPYSDVRLMLDAQMEINRSREAYREHRIANRPKYAVPENMLDDEEKQLLMSGEGNTVIEFRAMAAGQRVSDVLQPVQHAGLDPNMYNTQPFFTDIQMSVGAQEANFASVSGATATETSIAEAARSAATESEADELNDLLSALARNGGQVLLQELDEMTVKRIVGEGAIWPNLSTRDVQEELYLEVIAGSNGRPNRAQRAQTLQQLMPFLIQIPGLKPDWMARQVINALDEGIQLEDALAEGIPSILSMNAARQVGSGTAPDGRGGSTAPDAQGAEGGMNQESPEPTGDQPGPQPLPQFTGTGVR